MCLRQDTPGEVIVLAKWTGIDKAEDERGKQLKFLFMGEDNLPTLKC